MTGPAALAARTRLLLLLALYLLNPLTYAWWQTTGGLFPDSIAYLTFADAVLRDGQLTVTGMGHVDSGLILPPVYPLVVALGTALYGDAVLVSQWLPSIALMLAIIPLFLWLERATNAWMAAAAVAVIQWQPSYLLYGTSTLTEAFFILGVSALAYSAGRLLASGAAPSRYAWLGAGIALLFLTRQIGAFLIPAICALLALRSLYVRPPAPASGVLVPAGMLALGFTVVLGAYAAALYAQSGHGPWTQSFRLNQYVVTQPASPAAPDERSVESSNYLEVYAERRQRRRLTDDAREMQAYVIEASTAEPRANSWAERGATWLINLRANFNHVLALLGPLAAILALGGAALSLVPSVAAGAPDWRLLFPTVLFGYAALLSALTGLVERYIEAILPILIGQAFVAVAAIVSMASGGRTLAHRTRAGIALGTAAALLLTSPTTLFDRPRSAKMGMAANPLEQCRSLVAPRDGVFSFHAFEAYMLGARHRIVPNDTLERIAQYGRHTQTRWLLFRPSAAAAEESMLYTHATWMADPAVLFRHPDFVARCGSPDLTAILFEIRDV